MKTLLIFILISLTLPSFGQTKTDFLSCLNLIFSHQEFQPAFTNDPATSGSLIIVSGETPIKRNSISAILQIQRTLTQDDFRYFGHDVQILTEQDLERLGISPNAVLTIIASGSESSMKIMLMSNIKFENQTYLWAYNLVKAENNWEITGHSLSKQKTSINDW